MEIWEIVATVLGSNVATSIATYFTSKRSLEIKNRNDQDDVLLKRIDFLDKRITDIEKHVCFRENCDKRL